MNRQKINKTYYQKNQPKLTEQRRLNYQHQKQQTKTQSKNNLSDYYRANNIKVLISLKDYIESSPPKQRL